MKAKANSIGRHWVMAGLASGLVLAAATAGAQVADSERGLADAPLNLPKDLTMFGTQDPNLRKATAIVNGTIITDTDVSQRLALVLAANGGQIQAEEYERLKLQVLRNLIDESLQIQEAKANEIVIQPAEIDQTIARVASNFKRTPKDFAQYLNQVGSSEASMRRQIEGELAWRRLLGRRIEPFVTVGEEEVNAVIGRLKATKGAQEYHIGEIFLSSTSAGGGDALANAQRIVSQIRGGASFAAYARQFSEASTAAVGGDLGWVRGEQLPEPLAKAAQQLATGQISDPIAIPGGYSVIALVDKRQVLTADPRDALLSLKQLSISFPAGMTQAQASPRVAAFGEALKKVTGCGNAETVAATVGAEVVENDQIRIRDLPVPLQDMLLNLSIGQSTPPFGSLQDGVRGLVLCGRDDAPSASDPSFEKIYAQMEEERVGRRARRYLRDLRRDAVVDYR
ncbi:MAG: PpiC-type peptidyl-prolyl cis-trans isomerase [Sphingomonas bacterium]|nr:PpiC-type peptidyl-prolyl cis-trans isomerase [Sphingomonas bacterium]MDB5685178.1 PpiC-type peptidyl-prolyl cis-trans isomerase [Sphingomonas bacterium]MDB5717214.1 PpiC-type peptidyl-prolyl cis-trans isomerase [Sphingomonas bacterium]